VGRTRSSEMVVPDLNNAFSLRNPRVEDAARLEGYSVILCNPMRIPSEEKRHLSTLFSRRVDGVLLACSDAAALRQPGPPALPILCRPHSSGVPMPAVRPTTKTQATATCLSHRPGHERVALSPARCVYSPHAIV